MRPGSNGWLCTFSPRNQKISFAFLFLACAAVFAPAGRADSLHYFKNYFVTGDYAVAGVGLYGDGKGGVATGTINMNNVPQGADIVAAFLYWQTVEAGPASTAPAAINGTFVSNGMNNAIVGDVIGATPAPACWSPAGTTAPAGTAVTRVYRADVLRYLPVNSTSNIRIADGSYKIMLPDSGSNTLTTTPHTMGATLVVVYRILQVDEAPYKAVVIYDGAATLTRTSAAFSQTIGGFYQASGYGAKMTQIVGNGQGPTDVYLTVNGNVPYSLNQNVFIGAQGPRWDNPTFGINLPQNASSLNTQVLALNNQACLSWGAIITSTNVVNTDGDGILDSWKINGLHLNVGTVGTSPTTSVPATFGGCKDYPSDTCENFPKMGAVLGTFYKPHPDIFIQIDWMKSSVDGHIHSPKLAALQAIANVFSTHKIYVHFDVGTYYQQNPALPYIVPQAFATGGNAIQEEQNALECPNTLVTAANCAFPSLPYSVVGWKKGFDAIKNGFPVLGLNEYFPHDRKDTFHYILFGHALAGPFSQTTGLPLYPGTPPSSVSGVADTPGGDLLITLGLWGANDFPNCLPDDPTGLQAVTNLCTNQTGTWTVQAGTMMHELGHNLGLYHGGSVKVPNCMPDYPSVMSYLYQTKLLEDASGNLHVDYSNGLLAGLDENSLSETKSMGPLSYKVRYYAPPNSTQVGSVSQFHCDGTPATSGTKEVLLKSNGLVTPDWNNNGKVDSGPVAADINYNGTVGSVTADSVEPNDTYLNDPRKLWFVDHNDWGNLNFQQIGGRLNVDGLSADVGRSDLGQSDLGRSDLGQSDLGRSDLGQSDLGRSDLGQSDLGQSDLGKDVDYDSATSSLEATSSTAPLVGTITPSSVVIKNDPGSNQITLSWGPPSLGKIMTYTVYRLDTDAPGAGFVIAGTVPATPLLATYTFNDVITDISAMDGATSSNCYSASNSNGGGNGTSPCFNTHYEYYITATDTKNTVSTPSNFVNGVIVDHLFVTAASGTSLYGAAIPNFSASAATIIGLPSGAITSSGFTCAATNNATQITGTPRNVGTYTIACSGATTEGTPATDGVTYINGTLSITIRPLSIAAVTNTKTYDGTTSASAAPVPATGTPTSGSGLVNGDMVTAVETYDNRNVGTGKTLTVFSYIVSDGNNGNNYAVSTTTNSTGVINQMPITVTAAASTKTYDGTTSSASVPTITMGNLGTGDSVTWTETYDTNNVGTTHVMTPAGRVTDKNGGNNYSYTFVNINTGVITTQAITASLKAGNKTYDGTNTEPNANMGCTLTSVLSADISNVICTATAGTFNSSQVASATTVMATVAISGTAAANYTLGLAGTTTPSTSATASASITTSAIMATLMAGNKPYDGTAAEPYVSCTLMGVLPADTSYVICTATGGTFNSSQVGMATSVTAIVAISGTSAGDYTLGAAGTTTQSANAGAFASIAPAPVTITAIASTKTYDGLTSSTATPMVSPATLAGAASHSDTFTTLTEVYDTPNAGLGKTLTVSYVISDGNNGKNYSVATVSDTNGEIDTLYTNDLTLSDFTNGITVFGSFLGNGITTDGAAPTYPYTPTAATLATGIRFYASTDRGSLVVQFPSAISGIRVFPSIDHSGYSYDGYQYTISGSNDPKCATGWTPLFDATSVLGSGEPFTLGTFTGTQPNKVNNVFPQSPTPTGTDGIGSYGTVGYEADFVFSQAYACYSFGPSTAAVNGGNTDQELSGVASLP